MKAALRLVLTALFSLRCYQLSEVQHKLLVGDVKNRQT